MPFERIARLRITASDKAGEHMSNTFRFAALSECTSNLLWRFVLVLLWMPACFPALAYPQAGPASQQVSPPEDLPEEVEDQPPAHGDVIIDDRQILTVYQPVGPLDPIQRAEKIKERIVALARAEQVPAESVALETREAWTEIVANGTHILAVTDVDARLAGKPRKQLSIEYAGNIRQAIVNYRREHSVNSTLRNILFTVIATAILLPLAYVLRKLRLVLGGRLRKWIEARTTAETKKTALQISITYGMSLILALGGVLRWLLLICLFEVYLTIVLSFFPSSRSVSHAITGWIFSASSDVGKAALAYLPNLCIIAVVVLVASQLFRLITMVFGEIHKENLSIAGFYPEWAEPTRKLIRLAILVLVLIVIFPYLPGSKSPAFQGISIFVGVLLSLGSSSAVANAIAGVILTYMRSFSHGDWVKIGDVVGEVVEKNMLVTRIMTQKQEIITIPNATVMNGSVMNYTREAKHAGVIFHTTVTIGYDAPWKTVHHLLIGAAMETKRVLHQPAPFVLQTALNDFYVAYELNAYTDMPREMQFIY